MTNIVFNYNVYILVEAQNACNDLDVSMTIPERAYLGEETELKCYYHCTADCTETFLAWLAGGEFIYIHYFLDPDSSGPQPGYEGDVDAFGNPLNQIHSLIILNTQWGNATTWACGFYTKECDTGITASRYLSIMGECLM